jgi:hypothetical protein
MLQKVREAFDVSTFIEKYCVEVEIEDDNSIEEYIAICESNVLFMCNRVDFSQQEEINFKLVEYNKNLYLLYDGRMYINN